MKLKKLKKRNHQDIQLQLLKLIYQKKSLKTNKILLNKIAHIISKYNLNNKKILFLGFPSSFSQILMNSKHLTMPSFMWLNGSISNRSMNYKAKTLTELKNTFKVALTLKKKIDLIVVYDFANNAPAVKESYLSNIPIITINKNFSIWNSRPLYKTAKTYNYIYEKTENKFLFISFLQSVLASNKIKNANFIFLAQPDRATVF